MGSTNLWELASAILLSLGGAAVILAGLSGWLGQLWLKRILSREDFERTKELEAIKAEVSKAVEQSKAALAAAQARESAELQHRVHVSKTQFDLEFKLYQDLWNKIEAFRTASVKYWHPLKEALLAGPLSSREIATAVLKQKEIEAQYLSFIEFFLSQSPFISKSVKSWLDENIHLLAAINGVSNMVLSAVKTNDTKMFEEVSRAQLEINRLQEHFADVIRDRIESVSIVH